MVKVGSQNIFLGSKLPIKTCVTLSQRKYALDLLKEPNFLGCKPASTRMKANVDLWCDDSYLIDDPEQQYMG